MSPPKISPEFSIRNCTNKATWQRHKFTESVSWKYSQLHKASQISPRMFLFLWQRFNFLQKPLLKKLLRTWQCVCMNYTWGKNTSYMNLYSDPGIARSIIFLTVDNTSQATSKHSSPLMHCHVHRLLCLCKTALDPAEVAVSNFSCSIFLVLAWPYGKFIW